MKRVVVCVCSYLIFAATFLVASSFNVVSGGETVISNNETNIENYISTLYNEIDFTKSERLSYEVFNKAYRGYMNLRNASKLNTDKEIITICNFNLPSTENRLWIIDLAKKKVLFNTFVAHGAGSGDDCSLSFSNNANSHKSSLGFYVTGDTYDGEHGTSLHLSGMDEGFNDAAYDRGIVVHGADYVSSKFISAKQRLGRSWGCPAVPAKLSLPLINTIKNGTCLFIYYPDTKYLLSSYWVNKKITNLPGNGIYESVLEQEVNSKEQEIQNLYNGKTDSVQVVSVAQ
ncbi:MAG: murein L,D-transpeptidase catalytic domain family protein [Chitinophagales bacterium]